MCRFILLIHTPRFFEETMIPLVGPHEAGLVLEETVELNNSIARDPARHRVISLLRSGEKWHYGPACCRYLHVDFRDDMTYERDLAILVEFLRLQDADVVWPSEERLQWFAPDAPGIHRAIEYIDSISSNRDVQLLGYNTLRDALQGSTQAAVVNGQLDELMPDMADENVRQRLEKTALSYHHGTLA